MDARKLISSLTKEIEEYQRSDGVLAECHHYVFGVPLPVEATTFEYVVFGLNPGEQRRNWTDHPSPTKEAIDYDWQDHIPERSRASVRWRSLSAELCGERPVLMNDFFFWSTKTSGADFERRFGYRFLDSPHFEFCRRLNLRMIDALPIKAVLAPGLGHAEHFANLYGLRRVTLDPIRAANGHRLIISYERNGVPWIFTKHWTGSFGFSRDQRAQIREFVADQSRR